MEKMPEENTVENKFWEWLVESDFFVIHYFNRDKHPYCDVRRNSDKKFIQLHFCIDGSGDFIFGNGYKLRLTDRKMLLLYNPEKSLPIHIQMPPKSGFVTMLVGIECFHKLFSESTRYIDFLGKENRKYYKEMELSPKLSSVLLQITQIKSISAIDRLYVKAKAYESLCLFFWQEESKREEKCPFFLEKESFQKIRKAKEIVIRNMADPPSLKALGEQVDLSVSNLKLGFKQVYGKSVFQLLFEYKMEHAGNLLKKGQYNVNEVSIQMGYSSTSHFIESFKRQFGITPKQYAKENMQSKI